MDNPPKGQEAHAGCLEEAVGAPRGLVVVDHADDVGVAEAAAPDVSVVVRVAHQQTVDLGGGVDGHVVDCLGEGCEEVRAELVARGSDNGVLLAQDPCLDDGCDHKGRHGVDVVRLSCSLCTHRCSLCVCLSACLSSLGVRCVFWIVSRR